MLAILDEAGNLVDSEAAILVDALATGKSRVAILFEKGSSRGSDMASGVTAILPTASGVEEQCSAQTHHTAADTTDRANSSDRTSETDTSGPTGLATTCVAMMAGGPGLTAILRAGSGLPGREAVDPHAVRF